MAFGKLKLKLIKSPFLLSILFSFIFVITVLHKSGNQYREWWPRFTSEDGIREGELVVLENAKEAEQMLRIVHLDLKGAPPKLNYMRQLLPLLAQTGCNALLVEYEDMFPYHGILANVSAKNAYSQKQIMDFLSWCHDLQIEVIPLVQTFGHLEFVLKLEEFRHLRELGSLPHELCPSNPDSLTLVQEMLRQVLSLHRSVKYIHIGCDEVFHLAVCEKCTQRRLTSREIFATHVTQVAQYLKSSYSGITPLIWDDMMRRWNSQFITSTQLGDLVEPVVWVYSDSIQRLIPNYIWYWYTKTFKNVWVAGAFKGATSSTSVLPNIYKHYENQKAWLNFVSKTPTKVRGFVLTGWSRYDHFAILCELLPSSIPSLLLNLIVISSKTIDDHEKILKNWMQSMKCAISSDLNINTMTSDPRSLSSCRFTGSDAYFLMNNYLNLKNRVDWLYTYLTEREAWMTPYNVKHNFTSPWRIVKQFSKDGTKLLIDVQMLKNETAKILLNYFDAYTTEEWIEQRIEPLEIKMNTFSRQLETLTKFETWPRRPLPKR